MENQITIKFDDEEAIKEAAFAIQDSVGASPMYQARQAIAAYNAAITAYEAAMKTPTPDLETPHDRAPGRRFEHS